MPAPNSQNVKRRVEWIPIRDFECGTEARLVVRVSRADGKPPMYQLQAGRMVVDYNTDEPRLIPHIPIKVTRQNGKVTLLAYNSDILLNLIQDAERHIVNCAQEDEDERMQGLISKETADANRGKGKQPMGLKQLSKRDAANRTAASKENG